MTGRQKDRIRRFCRNKTVKSMYWEKKEETSRPLQMEKMVIEFTDGTEIHFQTDLVFSPLEGDLRMKPIITIDGKENERDE